MPMQSVYELNIAAPVSSAALPKSAEEKLTALRDERGTAFTLPSRPGKTERGARGFKRPRAQRRRRRGGAAHWHGSSPSPAAGRWQQWIRCRAGSIAHDRNACRPGKGTR